MVPRLRSSWERGSVAIRIRYGDLAFTNSLRKESNNEGLQGELLLDWSGIHVVNGPVGGTRGIWQVRGLSEYRGCRCRFERESKSKFGASAKFATRSYLSAVGQDEMLYNGKTQSCSLDVLRPGPVCAIEPFEDAWKITG